MPRKTFAHRALSACLRRDSAPSPRRLKCSCPALQWDMWVTFSMRRASCLPRSLLPLVPLVLPLALRAQVADAPSPAAQAVPQAFGPLGVMEASKGIPRTAQDYMGKPGPVRSAAPLLLVAWAPVHQPVLRLDRRLQAALALAVDEKQLQVMSAAEDTISVLCMAEEKCVLATEVALSLPEGELAPNSVHKLEDDEPDRLLHAQVRLCTEAVRPCAAAFRCVQVAACSRRPRLSTRMPAARDAPRPAGLPHGPRFDGCGNPYAEPYTCVCALRVLVHATPFQSCGMPPDVARNARHARPHCPSG